MVKEVIRGNTTTEVIGFTMENCTACGIPFFMPTCYYNRLVANKGKSFYCPNGHGMHFSGSTDAQKLKKQLEEEREIAEKEKQDLTNRFLDAMNETNRLKKQMKRVHAGVCPCCNRTFTNLAKHMSTKHPEVKKAKN